MPLVVRQLDLPPENLTESEARQVIADFLRWLPELFDEIVRAAQEDESFRNLFIDGFLERIVPSLRDFYQSEVLWTAIRHIEDDNTYEEHIRDHGLYGAQLYWKLSNTRYWLDRYLGEQRPNRIRRFLPAINGFLKSAVSSIPGGGAAVEIIEALENSLNAD